MNLDQIETKCFILALFIRDDGERFLLGSRAYEFVDSQLHFAANSYQNDIVEVQGNDGVMLAGQVRRGTSQAFDGYIGDQTVDRPTIEQYRRDFMKFFRKNHYYKVVYVFPDGSAVQRRNGFIVEAPEVKELYQLFPKYHISMNFEDINYYMYEEDADGQEIYGESATLKIATAATGGLIWEELSQTTLTGEGTNFSLDGTVNGNPISNVQLKGDTTQQTYSGKNLLIYPYYHSSGRTNKGITFTVNNDGTLTLNGQSDGTGASTFSFFANYSTPLVIKSGTYYFINPGDSTINFQIFDGTNYYGFSTQNGYSRTFTSDISAQQIYIQISNNSPTNFNNFKVYPMLTTMANPTASDYEPYVGGIPAPNPSYPQTVNTVTGRQVVTISDGGSQSQSYEVNLGKNLFLVPLSIGGTSALTKTKLSDNSFEAVWSGGNLTALAEIPVNGLLANTTYTLSYDFEITGDTLTNSGKARLKSEGTWTSLYSSDNKLTFTTGATGTVAIGFYSAQNDGQSGSNTIIYSNIQIEKGSTATTYAPYISHFGKNMLDMNLTENGGIDANGANAVAADNWRTAGYINAEPNTAYTYSMNGTLSQGYVLRFYQYDSNYNFISPRTEGVNNTITVTTGANTRYIRLVLYSNVGTMTKQIAEGAKLMLEQGSTATPYQQFIGGQLELCKIGTYQDYIYKSGDDWYVHKETKKIDLSTLTWEVSQNVLKRTGSNAVSDIVYPTSNDNVGQGVIEKYIMRAATGISGVGWLGYMGLTSNDGRIIVNVGSGGSDPSGLAYYALKTATDTQITNADLVAQLEALAGATTYDGQTIFTVSSPNQLAILSLSTIGVGGGGVMWDEYGAEWEEGTGGGPTTITVDSIDNVYPVWTVTGPAVNPQISVLTTNTTLSYSGTVTSSQELKIDMFNKTATLNGASVVGNVSGDWVYLKPGVNRITYTTNNADASDSTIWWQEIVG